MTSSDLPRRAFVGLSMVSGVAGFLWPRAALAKPVAVGLQGLARADPPTREKNFSINFNVGAGTWTESEPGSTSEVFKTKAGPYVTVTEGTYLKDAKGVNAGFLQHFNPETAKEGEGRGDGKANETGRTFEWKVLIVTT